MNKRI